MSKNRPKYKMVKEYILQKIENGLYQPHQVIESEHELSQKLEVSRITVRKGIEELVNAKILTKKKGIGTFVNPLPKFFAFKSGIGFSAETKSRGLEPSTELLKLEKIFATEKEATDMRVDIGAELWLVERIRYADNIPISYELEYFDALIVPYLDSEICTNSIYEYLKTQDIEYQFVDQQIGATLSDEKTSEYLDIKMNSPLINIKNIACLENGKPFNTGHALYQTDSFFLMHTVYK